MSEAGLRRRGTLVNRLLDGFFAFLCIYFSPFHRLLNLSLFLDCRHERRMVPTTVSIDALAFAILALSTRASNEDQIPTKQC